jgi:hypothetical protein
MYLNLKDSSAAKLRKAIQANAIFSAASGLLIVVAIVAIFAIMQTRGLCYAQKHSA